MTDASDIPALAELSSTSKSIRQLIIEAIYADFQKVDQAIMSATGDNWPITISQVYYGPLDQSENRKRFTVGLVPGGERETWKYPIIDEALNLDVEWRYTVNAGDGPPMLMAEAMLTVVKRVLSYNRSWNGLAIDTRMTGNENDMRTYLDKAVNGVVHCMITYRISTKDPRTNEPAFD